MARKEQMENVRFYKRLRKKLISINVTKGIDHTKTLKQSHKVQINRKKGQENVWYSFASV